MESNFSIYSTLLTMESLEIPTSNIVPAFIFGALTYCGIMFFNMSLALTIAFNRKLHKPMYILMLNMHINDMMGATVFFPHLLFSILTQNRSLTYTTCYAEAFLTHIYGTGLTNLLIAMAYDIYIAICCPLKYNTLMSSNNLLKLIAIVWSYTYFIVGVVFILSYRERICSTRIIDIFCNNPSLLRLICGDIAVNNYFGLFVTFFQQSLTVLSVVFTYVQILVTVVYKRQADVKSKAIQTCGTHLTVFLCLEFCILFSLTVHRIEGASANLRKALGASIMIFPPILNPLIYGLKTKEIRQNLIFLPKKKKVLPEKQRKKNNKMK
ncbi:olfactory receptor 52Z1-like [Astyanax mexicanus]|uniref:Olfactory receptor 52Z1-like n=1 Tax=Astyanax mexicanus TaxID=7994 RepID=A0A8T2L5M6_ASTMX|nr:olfactory receptor 52Z1-like [Astyanax mexicanus]